MAAFIALKTQDKTDKAAQLSGNIILELTNKLLCYRSSDLLRVLNVVF